MQTRYATSLIRSCVLGTISFSLVSCSSLHRDTTLAMVPSPDGKYVARAIEGNYGATTTGKVTHVLLKENRWLAAEEYVLIAKNTETVALKWSSPTQLIVQCAQCTDPHLFLWRKTLGGVEVKLMRERSSLSER